MANVFLSYARDDTGKASSLARILERAGYSVWWDRNIEGGSEYAREIEVALHQAEVVAVLWSVHSIGSAWVRDEAASGRDTNRLVPISLDASDPPLGFRQYQTIDLSRWNGRDGTALKTLKSAIAAKIARPTDPVPETPPNAGRVTGRRLPVAALAAGALLAAAAGAYFLLAGPAAGVPTIGIVAAPNGGEPTRSQALAGSLSIEMGAMQAGAASGFDLREAAVGVPEDVDYLIQVASSSSGATTTADLSLLDRKERRILWTSHFDKHTAEQAELRPQAAARLQPVLRCLAEANGGGRDTLDRPTLKLYLRGCEKFADSIGGLVDEDQLSLLRQVVDRAPDFAPAIAHLALIEANAERAGPARALIARAKKLDAKLAKIYLAEENLIPRSAWRKRQSAIAAGLAVNPDDASLHAAMSFELHQVGLGNDAFASARRAVELDPGSPAIRADLIQILNYTGRTTEADAELAKAEKIWPASTTIRDARYAFDLRIGDPARALRVLQQNQGMAVNYTKTRMPDAGIEPFLRARINPSPANIDKMVEANWNKVRREPANFGAMLLSLAIFNRIDTGYAIFENPLSIKALPESSGILFRSYLKRFRQDARFMPLAARIGLVRFWSDTGKWPDFCFEPDLPYDCKVEAAKLKSAGLVR